MTAGVVAVEGGRAPEPEVACTSAVCMQTSAVEAPTVAVFSFRTVVDALPTDRKAGTSVLRLAVAAPGSSDSDAAADLKEVGHGRSRGVVEGDCG